MVINQEGKNFKTMASKKKASDNACHTCESSSRPSLLTRYLITTLTVILPYLLPINSRRSMWHDQTAQMVD